MSTEYKVIVVLVKLVKPLEFAAQMEGVVAAMTDNTNFSNQPPPIPLSTVTEHIAAYRKTLPKGAATNKARQDARRDLEQDADHLVDFVQWFAEKAPMETAAAIAASAKMRLKKRAVRPPKAPITVTHGKVGGTVVVRVKAVGRNVMYYYSYSLDGKTWTEVQLHKSKITISGLTPGQTYQFRFRAFKKGEFTDFSQVVTLLVL